MNKRIIKVLLVPILAVSLVIRSTMPHLSISDVIAVEDSIIPPVEIFATKDDLKKASLLGNESDVAMALVFGKIAENLNVPANKPQIITSTTRNSGDPISWWVAHSDGNTADLYSKDRITGEGKSNYYTFGGVKGQWGSGGNLYDECLNIQKNTKIFSVEHQKLMLETTIEKVDNDEKMTRFPEGITSVSSKIYLPCLYPNIYTNAAQLIVGDINKGLSGIRIAKKYFPRSSSFVRSPMSENITNANVFCDVDFNNEDFRNGNQSKSVLATEYSSITPALKLDLSTLLFASAVPNLSPSDMPNQGIIMGPPMVSTSQSMIPRFNGRNVLKGVKIEKTSEDIIHDVSDPKGKFLVIQSNRSDSIWYCRMPIEGVPSPFNVSYMANLGGYVTTFDNCKVWVECTTDDGLTYAIDTDQVDYWDEPQTRSIYAYTNNFSTKYKVEIYWVEPMVFFYNKGSKYDPETGTYDEMPNSSAPTDNDYTPITKASAEFGFNNTDTDPAIKNIWYGFNGINNRIIIVNMSNVDIQTKANTVIGDNYQEKLRLSLYDSEIGKFNSYDPDFGDEHDQLHRFGNDQELPESKIIERCKGEGEFSFQKIFLNISGTPGEGISSEANNLSDIGIISISLSVPSPTT